MAASVWMYHRRIGIGLPGDGGNHPHGDRISQSLRAPEGKDHLALAQLAVVRQGKSRQFSRVHLDYRKIEFSRYANNLCANNAGTCGKRRLKRALDIGIRQNHLHALRPANHMRIRHDVPALVEHKTGSDGPLSANNRVRVGAVTFFERTVSRDQDLHRARRNSLDQRIHGLV